MRNRSILNLYSDSKYQGAITIGFSASEENAMVSLIQVDKIGAGPCPAVVSGGASTPYPSPSLPQTTPPRTSSLPSPLSSPTPVSGMELFIDSGTPDEDTSIVTGTTWKFGISKSVKISGNDQPSYFRTHRSGRSFKYVISSLVPSATYKVSLGFAEIWRRNCYIGKRVMELSLNGNTVNPDLDVFKGVGCENAYVETHSVKATSSGTIEVELRASKEFAMVSFIQLGGKSKLSHGQKTRDSVQY